MIPYKIEKMITRYDRQLILPNFGIKSQIALKNVKVAIVGCGGLGSPVIQYLAAAGVGQFSLYDTDLIELSNLHRQTIYRQKDIGRSKSQCAAEFINNINPEIIVEAKEDWISIHNVRKVVAAHDIILDCTDGLPNKYLLNDASVLESRPLIHGSITMLEGRLLTIAPGSSCLRCMFGLMPPTELAPSCQQVGVLGPICGIIGSMMANEAIKLIITGSCASMNNYIVGTFDTKILMTAYKIKKNKNCPACGINKLTKLVETNYIQQSCKV